MNQQPDKDPIVLSYLGLRRAVGVIGCYLPFALIFGKLFLQSRGLENSISSYYYTTMGDVFVGSMCAIGIFLMSCRGYDRRDAIAGHLACVFAVVYTACGLIILACIALIAVCKATGIFETLKPTLEFESLAILAFGVAWLTKGEAILKDVEEPQPSSDAGKTIGAHA
jgi:hypothetical protein